MLGAKIGLIRKVTVIHAEKYSLTRTNTFIFHSKKKNLLSDPKMFTEMLSDDKFASTLSCTQ